MRVRHRLRCSHHPAHRRPRAPPPSRSSRLLPVLGQASLALNFFLGIRQASLAFPSPEPVYYPCVRIVVCHPNHPSSDWILSDISRDAEFRLVASQNLIVVTIFPAKSFAQGQDTLHALVLQRRDDPR